MQRSRGWCGWLLFCSVLLAGCGGGASSEGASGSAQAGIGEKTSLASESSPTAGTDLGTLADKQWTSDTKTLSSVIRPLAKSPFGFARNGQFHVYAANGSRKRLQLDFDTQSYAMTDSLGQATSGTFSEDAAEPGTYVFASARITSAVNTARFRITPDAVVGAFPFEKPWSDPVAYQVMPFVAARAFVTDPAQLDGTYNRFGVSRNSSGTSDSQILAMRISGFGTALEICFDNTIYRIESCPATSKRTYAITSSPEFVWTAINIAAPADLLQFRMARIGGKNVWLSGGHTDAAPNVHVFRVGLQNSPDWPKIRYVGVSTESSWGTNVFDTATSVQTLITPEGATGELALPFVFMGGPQGIRNLNPWGVKKYFAMQNGVLSVIVGSRNTNTQGYIQINLFKEAFDARSGRYTVFATNGTEQVLDIDFDTRRYAMTAPDGDIATGSFDEDPNDLGTYIFASERIAHITNTARFRAAADAVVGAFPFTVFKSDPTAYTAQPFVAVRSFVTEQVELAGLYDVLVTAGSSRNEGFYGTYWQLLFSLDGTTALQCGPGLGPCSPTSAEPKYSVTRGDTPDSWVMKRSGQLDWTFRIAKIGGRKVLLRTAQEYFPSIPAIPIWSLTTGFRDSPGEPSSETWPQLNTHNASTAGTFGTASIGTGSYTSQYVRFDGASASLELTLQADPANSQVRQGTDSTGARYLVLQNGAMSLMMPMGPAINHLHIGLID